MAEERYPPSALGMVGVSMKDAPSPGGAGEPDTCFGQKKPPSMPPESSSGGDVCTESEHLTLGEGLSALLLRVFYGPGRYKHPGQRDREALACSVRPKNTRV